MSSVELPMGDRRIAELLDNIESEAGVKIREVIERELQLKDTPTKEYVTAMVVAFS